jgi:hypothetical protein
MFSWVLKILPQLDESTLKKMERTLQSRFTRIAKSFGKGLVNVLKGGGIAGLALGVIDKLLNPLKEVQEAIDRTLKSSDDIATNARQFGTTSGRLAKVIALGKAAGLDQDNLFLLMTKFQTAIAEANADPTKATAVRQYSNDKDISASFVEFIQMLQKLEKNQQILVQQEVFGEKQILKMSDFLQTDFAKAYTDLGLGKISSDKLSSGIDKNAANNDLKDTLKARLELEDLVNKSKVINKGIIEAMNESERLALQRENQRISSYQSLNAISQTVEKMGMLLDKAVTMLGTFIPKVTGFIDEMIIKVNAILKSPVFRNFFGGKKD